MLKKSLKCKTFGAFSQLGRVFPATQLTGSSGVLVVNVRHSFCFMARIRGGCYSSCSRQITNGYCRLGEHIN